MSVITSYLLKHKISCKSSGPKTHTYCKSPFDANFLKLTIRFDANFLKLTIRFDAFFQVSTIRFDAFFDKLTIRFDASHIYLSLIFIYNFLKKEAISMLKRKAYQQLLDWKNTKHNKSLKEALLIKGARQVGKSYLVEKFGKKEYKSFIEINFIKQPELKNAFRGNKSPEAIYQRLSIYFPKMKLLEGRTLFFLDEIQNCGDARTAIKFLASDLRYDFIASGSLLGLEYGEDDEKNVEVPESIPVGYESAMVMYPMDFEEYLWSKGYEDKQLLYVKSFFDKGIAVPSDINEKMESLFREYIVVGGMPEVVDAFEKSNNFNEAIRVQDKIITDYQGDISNHAKGDQKIKVRQCYDSIPKQLAREIKKFQYSVVETRQTSRKFSGSIKWLKDSALVNACYNVREPYIPLMANEIEEQFKLYINDTGLLTEMYGRETKIAILNNTLKGNAKGAIYENVVSELLVKKGYKLHYYRPDDNQELEFLIEKDGEVLPIEVKAGNAASISLNNFIKSYSPKVAYKLINGNVGIDGVKKTVPHYMVLFI